MRMIASRPSRGRLPCAARPRVSTSNQANPLWPIAICRSVGSVTTAASARQRVTSASAPMLAYSSSTTAATISRPAASRVLRDDPRRVDHRGDAAFHVLRRRGRTAGRRARRDRTARAMPSTPTVSTWPQSISDRPRPRPSSTPMTFGRPGAASCISTSRPMLPQVRGDRRGDRRFAGRARHERRIDRIDRDEIAQQPDGGVHDAARSSR